MLRKAALILTTLCLLAIPAFAQKTGPNGGLVEGKGSHQTELLISATELTVYLLENGKPHDTKGMNLRAVIQESGKTSTITFVNQDGTRMTAKLAAPLNKGAIVVLTGKDHHGDTVSARYKID
jgi:hypothetical protein